MALSIDITANANETLRELDRVQRALGRVEGQVDKVQTRSQKFGQVIGGAAVLYGIKSATDAASDLEQAVGATETVFGDAIDTIDSYAKTSVESFGLSERAFRESVAPTGAMLQQLGYTSEAAALTSAKLVGLAADFSAAFGGSTADAIAAMNAALRGEFDPLERYGVKLSAAAIEAKALEMGLANTKAELTDNAKAQAALALITEKGAIVQGQFAREADTAAVQQQKAQAQFENTRAELGESLLPVLTQLMGVLGGVAQGFGALPDPLKQVGVTGALAGGALLKLNDYTTDLATTSPRLASALKAIGWVGLIAGAASYANSLSEVKVNTEDLLGASEELSAEQARNLEALSKLKSENLFSDQPLEALYKMRDALGASYDAESNLGRAIADGEEKKKNASSTNEKYAGEVAEITGETEDAVVATRNLSDILSNGVGKTKDATDAVNDQADALKRLNDETQAQIDLVGDEFDARLGYDDAVRSTEEAQLALADARKNGDAADVERAEADLTRAIQRQAEAAETLYRKTAEAEGATYNAGIAADVLRQEYDKARRMTGYWNDDLQTANDRLDDVARERRVKIDTEKARIALIELAALIQGTLGGKGIPVTQVGGSIAAGVTAALEDGARTRSLAPVGVNVNIGQIGPTDKDISAATRDVGRAISRAAKVRY